jgi:hypothetical protein
MQATMPLLGIRQSREGFKDKEKKCLIIHILLLDGAPGWRKMFSTLGQCPGTTSSAATFVMVLLQISTTVGRSALKSQKVF